MRAEVFTFTVTPETSLKPCSGEAEEEEKIETSNEEISIIKLI